MGLAILYPLLGKWSRGSCHSHQGTQVTVLASHGRTCPAKAGHGQPWPAMAGHGWPWMAMDGRMKKKKQRLTGRKQEQRVNTDNG